MIAFKDGLPVIQMANGRAVAFERDWLVRSLISAAQRAGYGKWWLAEHVAESVTSYLRDQKDITVLPIEKLTAAVRSALQVIGYGEVGQYFEPQPLQVQVSLVDMAREAGTGYELAFFERLRRCLRQLLQDRSRHFELLGLEPCVKLLRARKVWCRGCDALRAEIVHFARQQAGTTSARNEITFALR